jgi:hypothetical protein
MKKALFCLMLALSPMVWSQDSKCNVDYKTGTFIYEDPTVKAIIVRTETQQKESWNDGKSFILMKIKWQNDSTYVLTVKKVVNAPGCVKKGTKIWTTIESCDGKKINFSYKTKSCGDGKASMIIKRQ